jgi:hypothetical protein
VTGEKIRVTGLALRVIVCDEVAANLRDSANGNAGISICGEEQAGDHVGCFAEGKTAAYWAGINF